MIVRKRSRALAARKALGVESSVSAYKALVLNRLVADGAIISGACDKVFCLASRVSVVFGFQSVFESANFIQEVGQPLMTAGFALQLQSTLKTDADQKLEIMR
jgi:hypothetical protein